MSQTVKILGIAGSLRKESFNKAVLRAAQQLVPAGATLQVFDLASLPMYNQDEEKNPPASVVEFKKAIRAADAILFVTPEYNYSVPGVLKNAIDLASRPYGDSAWDGKPTAIMGASMGAVGTARAQYHLRQSMVWLNMHPLNGPEVMVGAAHERIDAQGVLKDEKTREIIAKQLKALVAWTQQLQRGKAA